MVVALLSGWVIAIVLFPLAAIGLPVLLGVSDESHTIERLEGLAEWTRNLAGVIRVGAGLEGRWSTRCDDTDVDPSGGDRAGGAGLRSKWDTEEALRAFADEFNDPTGDLVAATLILAAQTRGTGCRRSCPAWPSRWPAEVSTRRQLEADRAKPRQTARIVTIITVGALAVLLGHRPVPGAYRVPEGQVVLSVLLALYAGAAGV